MVFGFTLLAFDNNRYAQNSNHSGSMEQGENTTASNVSRWTPPRKSQYIGSRIENTTLLLRNESVVSPNEPGRGRATWWKPFYLLDPVLVICFRELHTAPAAAPCDGQLTMKVRECVGQPAEYRWSFPIHVGDDGGKIKEISFLFRTKKKRNPMKEEKLLVVYRTD